MKKIIFGIVVFIELIAIAVSIAVPVIGLYRDDEIRGYKYSYKYFDDNIVDYKTLFYDPPTLEYELYTLGFTSQEGARILKGRKYYKSLREFDENTIVKFNDILKQCHFKPVDKKKASVLSIFVSDFTNVAYTQMRDDYISPEMLEAKVENDSFKPEVLKYVMDKGFGVSMASINRIFGKTYMFVMFYSGQDTVTLKSGDQYIVPDYSNEQLCVFEIVPDDGGKELISNRKNFRFYKSDGFVLNLSFFNPINYTITFSLLGLLLITVIVYFIITRRRKKMIKAELEKAESKKSGNRKAKLRKAKKKK